jgi:hypothetical protein
MRSMVAAMSILRQELEKAAEDSRAVKAAAAKDAMEAKEQEVRDNSVMKFVGLILKKRG